MAALSEIEEVELLVMVPLKVEPSFSVTVAFWPDPGPWSLAQPQMDIASAVMIAMTTIFKACFPLTSIAPGVIAQVRYSKTHGPHGNHDRFFSQAIPA